MATKRELETKKELARMYYMQGETQKSIALKTGVSEQTVGKWVEKEVDKYDGTVSGITIISIFVPADSITNRLK